jgi:hypothetical protein
MRRIGLGSTLLAAMAMMMSDGASVEAQGRHGLHIPPGHMPRPGECRVWYHGRPPGHQPPAVPCGALRGYRFPGAVVIGAPVYAGGFGYWDDGRDGFRFRLLVEWSPEEIRRFRDPRFVADIRFDDRDRPKRRKGRGRDRR